ncbi:MAG: hypothetical protein J0I54_02730 [Bosea sp.]|uniref:hypothetical protein n=1 Tax=unclassified Bosea (in: a-proteobacteria) TaxID=2653178 RepID=UPI001AC964F5|nr:MULTISPECIES: hypothetical protein [unclassified Bosea (in: a-proteobacteria)]MBN9455523.1 hypothetical protein [Bosea sp. (in: a-proteobacteria)]
MMLMVQTLAGTKVDQTALSSTRKGRAAAAILVSPVGHGAFDRCIPIAMEKNLAADLAGFGMRCFDNRLVRGEVGTVAPDRPAVAGLHDVLDYDCRPKCSGGGKRAKAALLSGSALFGRIARNT